MAIGLGVGTRGANVTGSTLPTADAAFEKRVMVVSHGLYPSASTRLTRLFVCKRCMSMLMQERKAAVT